MSPEDMRKVEVISAMIARRKPSSDRRDYWGIAWEALENVRGTRDEIGNAVRRSVDIHYHDTAQKGRKYSMFLKRAVYHHLGRDYDPSVHSRSDVATCFESPKTADTFLAGLRAFEPWRFPDFGSDAAVERPDESPSPEWCAEYNDLLDRFYEDIESNLDSCESSRQRQLTILHERVVNGLSKTDIERKYGWPRGAVAKALSYMERHLDEDCPWGKVYREESPGRRDK